MAVHRLTQYAEAALLTEQERDDLFIYTNCDLYVGYKNEAGVGVQDVIDFLIKTEGKDVTWALIKDNAYMWTGTPDEVMERLKKATKDWKAREEKVAAMLASPSNEGG